MRKEIEKETKELQEDPAFEHALLNLMLDALELSGYPLPDPYGPDPPDMNKGLIAYAWGRRLGVGMPGFSIEHYAFPPYWSEGT